MTTVDSSEPSPFRYVHTANSPALLEQIESSLVVTTYQAGKLMLVRSAGGKLSTLLRSFEKPMGLTLSDDRERLVVGTRRTVWTLRSAPEIAPQLEPKGKTTPASFCAPKPSLDGENQGSCLSPVMSWPTPRVGLKNLPSRHVQYE